MWYPNDIKAYGFSWDRGAYRDILFDDLVVPSNASTLIRLLAQLAFLLDHERAWYKRMHSSVSESTDFDTRSYVYLKLPFGPNQLTSNLSAKDCLKTGTELWWFWTTSILLGV